MVSIAHLVKTCSGDQQPVMVTADFDEAICLSTGFYLTDLNEKVTLVVRTKRLPSAFELIGEMLQVTPVVPRAEHKENIPVSEFIQY